ncbi:uncharacterized protein LOC135221404 [Macrobrachium nipponense]|uniref:uncharacterized protein LOC135221404 n=1 Tax=Macrobrachium nipponense TaxID=159736 RepID=UPI0030C8C604
MTTYTITIGAAGLAAGAAAVAVAGAVGLGLAGVAALFSRRGGTRRKNKKHQKKTYSRYGREDDDGQDNLKRMMELIRREDVTGCGLRLMCELAAENPRDLIDEEMAILDLVGAPLTPGEDIRGLGALGEYREAKALGLSHGSCGKTYFMCPLNGTQLMETVMGFLP